MSQSQVRIRLAQDSAVRQLDELLDASEAADIHHVDAAMLARLSAHMGELSAERAIRRLVAQGRLLRPSAHVAHWVIVPAQFQSSALLPPELWMDAYFCGTLKIDYYVSLLSAAALLGVAPECTRVAHVAAERSRATLSLGLFECRFHTQPNIASAPTQWHATRFGRLRVSTPEMTALDLAKRQARRVTGCDIRSTIELLLSRSSEPGLQSALTAAQNLDAAERLAEVAAAAAPAHAARIAAWCADFRRTTRAVNRAPRLRRP